VHYPGEAIARHPWPLYEAALLCVLAVVFARPLSRSVRGRRAVAYVMCYAALRLLLEPLRGDIVRGVFWSISTSQLIAACVIVGCAYALKKLRPATLSDVQENAAGRGSVTKSVTASAG
jgi:prolipoprotein diacylglyceryltransferase